eukprot:142280_1
MADPDASGSLDCVLKGTFGFNGFRPHQKEIISAVLSGRDCFVLMSTGSGKSLCYQLPPLITKKPVIVVSPLISLMEDQVMSLTATGISACCITGAHRDFSMWNRAKKGEFSLIYLSPEKVTSWIDQVGEIVKSCGVTCFAIDEAHCVSEWGHDFRPSYRRLSTLRARFPGIPVLAMTATATVRVRSDICSSLLMSPTALRVCSSLNRPNLHYAVRSKRGINEDLTRKLIGNDSAIIYTLRRADCAPIVARLRSLGVSAAEYHAGLGAKVRSSVHARFIRDETQCVVATVAFGMGIDKPDIRTIVHYGLPKSLEAYYQQTGRAGRDGMPSKCVLLWGPSDLSIESFYLQQASSSSARQQVASLFAQIKSYANDRERCRREMILEYFGEIGTVPKNCKNCDNCEETGTNARPKHDFTFEARKVALAVRETGERFGMEVPLAVVKGNSGKLANRRFSRPPESMQSFGALSARSAKWLTAFSRAILQARVLTETFQSGYRNVRVGSEGHKLLADQSYVLPPILLSDELISADSSLSRKLKRQSSDLEQSSFMERFHASRIERKRESTLSKSQSNEIDAMLDKELDKLSYSQQLTNGIPNNSTNNSVSSSSISGINTQPLLIMGSVSSTHNAKNSPTCSQSHSQPIMSSVSSLKRPTPPTTDPSLNGSDNTDLQGPAFKRRKAKPAVRKVLKPTVRRVLLYTMPKPQEDVNLNGKSEIAEDSDIISFSELLPSSSAHNPIEQVELSETETALLGYLKKHRKVEAQMTGAAPYTILSDAVLHRLARARPDTSEAFARVDGVTVTAAKKYGPRFIKKITSFSKAKGLTLNAVEASESPKPKKSEKSEISPESKINIEPEEFCEKCIGEVSLPEKTSIITTIHGDFQGGKSISEIISDRGLRRNTVIEHLCDASLLGLPLDWARLFFSAEAERRAFILLEARGLSVTEREIIRAAREGTGDEISKGDARLMLCKFIAERTKQVPVPEDFSVETKIESESNGLEPSVVPDQPPNVSSIAPIAQTVSLELTEDSVLDVLRMSGSVGMTWQALSKYFEKTEKRNDSQCLREILVDLCDSYAIYMDE